jgi:dTMP kinase
MFISLDGVDGAGKSTQIGLLVEWLRSQALNVCVCRDPGGTLIGDRLRAHLLDRSSNISMTCEMLLYMASRAQLVDEVIRPALARGDVVVCDRYLLANVVYQGHAGGLDPITIREVGRVATQGVVPDLTLVLDLPPEVSLERKSGPADRLESRGVEYLRKVRQGFLAEAALDPRHISVVSAQRGVTEVQQQLREEVGRVLASRTR